MTPGAGARILKVMERGASSTLRAACLAGALLALLAFRIPVAVAADTITLQVAPAVAAYGATVHLSGALVPAAPEHVAVFQPTGSAWQLVAEGDAGASGAYAFSMTARRPGQLVARATGAESAAVMLRIKPTLKVWFRGLPVLGAPLFVRGRLTPAAAGRVVLITRGVTRTVKPTAAGTFEIRIPTGRAGPLVATLKVDPAPGYVTAWRQLRTSIRTPILKLGTTGPAVLFLEQRLRSLRYALSVADRTYGRQTRDAVYAFQKVERLARDGVAGPQVWRALLTAGTPAAFLPRGNHVEVDKGRQVLFEVRNGRVVRIVHVSTGATGNTPVGRWRIYRKTPGYNALHMYYSMYFLRGFAVHGYASVPPFPASHGCVRTPIWFAPGLYSRWPVGALVVVR